MAYDKAVDSAQLEAALTATADAIREKTGDTTLIQWLADKGFADAVAAIESGGGDLKTVSGSFTPASRVATYELVHNLGVLPKVILVSTRISLADVGSTPASSEIFTISYASGYLTYAKFLYSAGNKFTVAKETDFDITSIISSQVVRLATETEVTLNGGAVYFLPSRTYDWIVMG